MAWEKPLPEAGIFLQVHSSPQRLYFLSFHLFCQAYLGFPEAPSLYGVCEFLLPTVMTTTLLFAVSLPSRSNFSCCDVFAVHGQSSGTGETQAGLQPAHWPSESLTHRNPPWPLGPVQQWPPG